MNNSKIRKIAAPFTALVDGIYRNCIITVDGNGIITNIEREVENIDSHAGVEYHNGLLIAGMVNCHNHVEYSYVKGMIPPGGGLGEFIRNIIEIKYTKPIEEQTKIDMAQQWDDIMFKNGITAVGDHNNNDYVYTLKENSRVYYHTFVELYDVDNQTAEQTFYQGMERVAEHKRRGLAASLVPHATYTLDDNLLAMIGGEKATSKGEFNDRDIISTHFYESTALGGANEGERVVGAISANHKSVIMVHGIYLNEVELNRAMNKYGDKLTLSPCPCSNMYIENRLPDFDMFRQKGVRVVLGTDGLSSNTNLSILEEMKCVAKHYPHISTHELVSWATINGAKALCIDDWAGSLEVGKKPGIVIVENVDMCGGEVKLGADAQSYRLV